MDYYSQEDFTRNKKEKNRALCAMLLVSLPFFAVGCIAFVLRIEWLCMAGCILCGCVLILLSDLKLKPASRYGHFLQEVHSGMTHKTLGTLVRVSEDLCYEDGVDFCEVILNIYEDMSEEGERRFLLDSRKEMPAHWMNRDIVVTSHGNYILAAQEYTHEKQEGDA